MQSVRAVLNRDKLPQDYPPSKLDVKTREKHVPESVDYNIKHLRDHGENICEQLEKLCQVDPAMAKRYAEKACMAVDKVYKDLEKYKKEK